MNPVTVGMKVAGATVQQVGRRLSSSHVNSSSYRVGRVIGSVTGTAPSSGLQQKQTARKTTNGVSIDEFTRQVASSPRRTKSSMALEIEEDYMSEEPTILAAVNATYDQSVREPFPSIVIGTERLIEPQGSFAEAQAQVSYNITRIKYLYLLCCPCRISFNANHLNQSSVNFTLRFSFHSLFSNK